MGHMNLAARCRLESSNQQKTNCVIHEFFDTHIDQIILKGWGKLQKEYRREEQELTLYTMVPESLYHQNMNCVEEDKFLDTHIDHIILKGCGKLQKKARRKEFRRKEEQEFAPDTLVPESLNHQKTNCVEEDEFLDTHIDHTILKGWGSSKRG